MSTQTGHCLCGAVAYRGKGGLHMHVCHCSNCRRWTGSPAMTLTFDDGMDILTPDNVRWYGNSDWAERGSCATCGSTLFYRMPDSGHINVSAGSLDDQSAIDGIAEHIFVDEKPLHYDFAGEAPRITGAEVFERFTGPQDGQS